MRPLVLEMNAFGPFKDQVVIDFREFNQSSLFLLTGPTGAGKTTIFDAISYVLYGSASGEAREESSLKSDYASDEEAICYVKLTFTIHDKTVSVYRRPRQKGPGKTKSVINLQPEFELIVDGHLVTNSIKDSTSEVQNLLGLSADQFKQIVMLPQGEFRKLLTSTSSEKEAIFRNIFKTDIFSQFEAVLKEKTKKYTKEKERIQTLLDQQVSQIVYDNRPDLTKAIEQQDYDILMDELKILINEDEKAFQNADKSVNELTKTVETYRVIIENMNLLETLVVRSQKLDHQKEEIADKKERLKFADQARELSRIDSRISQAEQKLQKSKQNLSTYKEKQATVQADWKEAKNAFETHQEQVSKIPELEESQTQLTEEQRLWKEKQGALQKIKEGEKTTEHLASQQQKSDETLKELHKQKEEVNQHLVAIPTLREQHKEKETEQSTVSDELREAKLKQKNLVDSLKERNTLEEVSEQETKQKATVKKLAEDLKVVSTKYYANIAVVLADNLEEDKPCPVCGSVHHPDVATTSNEDISKDYIEELESEFDKESAQLNTLQVKADHLNDSLVKKLEPLNIDVSAIDDALKEVKQQINQHEETLEKLTNETAELEKEINKEPTWRKEHDDINQQIRNTETAKQKAESESQFIQKQIETWQNKVEQITKTLTSESPEAVETKLAELKETIQSIQQKEKALSKQVESLNLEKETLQTSIKHTEQTIEDQQKELTALQKEFEETVEKYQFESYYKDYLLDESTQNDWQKEIDHHQRAVIETETKLNDVIAKLPAKDERQSLEQYGRLQEETEHKLAKAKSERDGLNTKRQTNRQVLKQLTELYEFQKENYQIGSLYTELSDMASGKDNLTNKISFERYVLGVYFDEILYAANQRFSQMTSGQYELERQTDNFSARRGNGLDLEVFDQFTGKKRSVKSLSGGEMFKASLSLAFGLSDVIQNELGGVEVNTLFIDEGFGTLDSDSLDQAIQVLMELNQGGRLIGIISHVDELKARIQSKIIVEKGQEGSHVELVH